MLKKIYQCARCINELKFFGVKPTWEFNVEYPVYDLRIYQNFCHNIQMIYEVWTVVIKQDDRVTPFLLPDLKIHCHF